MILSATTLSKARRHDTNVGRYVDKHADGLAKRLDTVLKTWGKKLARRAAAVYKEVRKADDDAINEILRRLALDGMSEEMLDELRPELLKTFKQAGRLGLEQVKFNGAPDITNQLDIAAKTYAEKRGGELIKDFVDTTEDYLRGVLTRGVEEGMSPADLSDAILDAGAFGQHRADMIARTELAFAHVQGNVEGWRATGEVSGKQSLLGDLHDVEDECDECADAGIVDLEDDFIPGYAFPPYHPNCICDVVPVLREEQQEEEE